MLVFRSPTGAYLGKIQKREFDGKYSVLDAKGRLVWIVDTVERGEKYLASLPDPSVKKPLAEAAETEEATEAVDDRTPQERAQEWLYRLWEELRADNCYAAAGYIELARNTVHFDGHIDLQQIRYAIDSLHEQADNFADKEAHARSRAKMLTERFGELARRQEP